MRRLVLVLVLCCAASHAIEEGRDEEDGTAYPFCGATIHNGSPVSTLNANAHGAMQLPKGTRGVAMCNNTDFQMLYVCFPTWHLGNDRHQFCSFPPPGSSMFFCPKNSGWWMSCDDLEAAEPVPPPPPSPPPLLPSPPSPPPSPPLLPSPPSSPSPPPHPKWPPGTMRHWALLIAGSHTWANYRHQADVYHAYQILRGNGIPDETIVVMHFDDIAHNSMNPRPGVVINSPNGSNVYKGVPKDYTGEQVNVTTFLAVLRGDAAAVAGVGSGRVIEATRHDKVFVYYADHGGPGVLGMPTGPFLYASQLVGTLVNMSLAHQFKEMVVYTEACESGSIFDGLLPDDANIFVTTAANGRESSWGCYCPGQQPAPPLEYTTCLGDKYSVSWMEDAEKLRGSSAETLEEEYQLVRNETQPKVVPGRFEPGSHVMQFGSLRIASEPVQSWVGTDNTTSLSSDDSDDQPAVARRTSDWTAHATTPLELANCGQHDATALHYQVRLEQTVEGTAARALAESTLAEFTAARQLVDQRVAATLRALANRHGGGTAAAQRWATATRTRGRPLVDDWMCLQESIGAWEAACGALGQYGMRHTRAFANLCNDGLGAAAVTELAASACSLAHLANPVAAAATATL